MNSSVGITISGGQSYDQFGVSVSAAGDLNGDGKSTLALKFEFLPHSLPFLSTSLTSTTGYADVVIGAPYANSNAGYIYIIYGSSERTNIEVNSLVTTGRGVIISGENGYDYSGFSLSGAGDINNDGLADVIIGSPGVNFAAGSAYVIYGTKQKNAVSLSNNMDSTIGFAIYSSNLYEQVGYSVSAATDKTGRILGLIGNDPVQMQTAKGICYNVAPSGAPQNQTKSPTSVPTALPTVVPTAIPTLLPTINPTAIPSLMPTPAPTQPPFWASNGPLILGVAVPAVLGFIPIFFQNKFVFGY